MKQYSNDFFLMETRILHIYRFFLIITSTHEGHLPILSMGNNFSY